MKVLVIPWNLYPEHAGGAGKDIYYLALGLSKLSQISAVHILTSTKNKTLTERKGKLKIERYEDLDIKFRTVNETFGLKDVKRKLAHFRIFRRWEERIRKKYSEFRPDIIHCNDPFVLRRVLNALKSADIPIVISVRGSWTCSSTGNQLDKKGKIIEKWTFLHTLNSHGIRAPYEHYRLYKNQKNLKKVGGVHFISKYIKDKTEEHVLLNSIRRVIFSSYPLPKKLINKEKELNGIAYLGELTYKKGPHKLLESLKILVDEGKDYKLFIAGVGPMEGELKRFVRENNLDKNVTFLGWVNEPNKIYQKSTITVVPSLWPETLGRTAYESMFNNSIPLVSKHGGVPETVPLKELVVDMEDPRKLANAIKKIMENPDKQKKIRKTFKPWLKKFNMETEAKQLFPFYEDVIKHHKKVKIE